MGRSAALYASVFESCPEDWDLIPFEEAVDFREGPGILAKDFREYGVPLLRLRNIERPYVDVSGSNYLDPEMVDRKWSHFQVEVGDLLVSTSGTLGRVSIASHDAVGSIPYTGIIRMRPAHESIFSGFIRYFLTSPLFQQQAEASAAGSVLQHFGPSHLREMSFPVPPKAEQEKIGNLLGTLDEKIELNRQMNRTLEAMARAIFKAWFVDFEPVKAKADGATSFRGMPETVFEQLPERFTETELGPVPEGWEVKPLDEIADFLNGLALQKYPATDSGDSLPVIKIAELRNGISAKSGRASRELPQKYVVHDGDFIFSWSGSLLAKFWTEGEGALNQHLFKVTSKTYPMWFVSQWVQYHLEAFQAIAASKATTMGHIQRRHLKEALTVCAPLDVLFTMSEVMAPLLDKMISGELEGRSLASIRNNLLPKLMSGEIRLDDAAIEVG
ncbi:restriction endonuclease subunit S [Salinisphaera sp. SPP-AMP-43]|uniref:restriction endonuclease subunit S n=1 Tax=Salinisphaera sp. SPP-AMP-43 TaxID=3121288 RepID=UPI003C6E7813